MLITRSMKEWHIWSKHTIRDTGLSNKQKMFRSCECQNNNGRQKLLAEAYIVKILMDGHKGSFSYITCPVFHSNWCQCVVQYWHKELYILLCSITPTNVCQFSKPGADLKSAGPDVFKTPPTCTIWPSFGWDIWG